MAATGPITSDNNDNCDNNHNIDRSYIPLPHDAFNHIASYLPLNGLLSLRQVCFKLKDIGNTNDANDLVSCALNKASASELTYYAQANFKIARAVLLDTKLTDTLAVSDLVRILGAHNDLYKPILEHNILNEYLDSFLLMRFSQLSENIALHIVQHNQLSQYLSEFDLLNLAFSSKHICNILAQDTNFINKINETFFFDNKTIVKRISQTQLAELCATYPILDFPHSSESSQDFFENNSLFDIQHASAFVGEYRRIRFSQSHSNNKCLIGEHVKLNLHQNHYNVFSMNLGTIYDKLAQDEEPCSFNCALKHNAQKEFIQESHKVIYLLRLIREQIQTDETECVQSLKSFKL